MKLRPNLQVIQFTAPTFVAVGTVGSGASTATPGLPAGHTTNDILLFLASVNDSAGTITPPTGYTSIATLNGSQTDIRAYWKRDGGAEAAQTISVSIAQGVIARMIAFRGCVATGSPIDQSATNADETNQTALTCPVITPSFPNTMVINQISMLLASTTTTQFSAYANASLASITEAIDNTTASGSGAGLGASYGVKTTGGIIDATTLTGVTNVHHLYMTFNLIGLRA